MEFFALIEEKWNLLGQKTKPMRTTVAEWLKIASQYIRVIWKYVYRMRTVFLAVPVVVATVVLAIQNMARLPSTVGIWLQSNGEFLILMPKFFAVMIPVAVTSLSILLLLGSKKVLYPWLVSLFTLVLPALIYYTNIFPM